MATTTTHTHNHFATSLLSSGGPTLLYRLATQTQAATLAWKSKSRKHSVVAVFGTHDEAEEAVRQMQSAGVDTRTLSIASRNTKLTAHGTGFYATGDRMLRWSKIGACVERFGGLSSTPPSLPYRTLGRSSFPDRSSPGFWLSSKVLQSSPA